MSLPISFSPVLRRTSRTPAILACCAYDAAVDNQSLARDVATFIAGQKQRCMGNIPSITHVTHWNLLVSMFDKFFKISLSVLVRQSFDKRRKHESGCNAVQTHATLRINDSGC